MKKIFLLLLCLILLTSCGQKSLPPELNYQVETTEMADNPEPISPSPAGNTVATDDIPSAEETPSEPVAQTVSIVVFGLDDKIIFTASAEYGEGMTVFELLLETAKKQNIPIEFSGTKSSPYVTSICGLKEKQHGPSSGWVYTVNNEMVMMSSGKMKLNPGDCVQWKYITKF